MIDVDSARPEHKRSLIEAMPEDLYGSLPSADITADVCSHIVERALAYRSPQLVTQWLEYEESRATARDLRHTLDLALDLAIRRRQDLRTMHIATQMRAEADAFLQRGPRAECPTDGPGSLIEGMLVAIGSFDPQLVVHSNDVASMADRMAQAAGLTQQERLLVSNAARVHEIGRLRVKWALLESPDVFDDRQRAGIREVLADTHVFDANPALRPVAETVYGMYLGDMVTSSSESRLLRVADAFQSLCEPRPYRKKLSPNAALERLRSERDPRFDRRYVELLADLLGFDRRYSRSA